MKEKLSELSTKIPLLKQKNLTEEPTKMSLIIPFLQILDYDVFNFEEVEPEFTADFGTKKGEKVDYAIIKDGKPVILIECKKINDKLDIHNSQLFRYFSTTSSKYAILTNGEKYEFYTDIEKSNIMDKKPFMKLDLSNLNDDDIEQLKKFHKSFFNSNEIFNSATDLKYISEIKDLIISDLDQPSEDFIKYYTSKIYNGRNTEKTLNSFSNYIKKAYKIILNTDFDRKIKNIVNKEVNVPLEEEVDKKSKIETTELELDSYFTIKSILREKYPDEITKLGYKDTINYFNVYLNGPRNTFVRLYLNSPINKYMVFIYNGEESEKYEINDENCYYNYEDILIENFKNMI